MLFNYLLLLLCTTTTTTATPTTTTIATTKFIQVDSNVLKYQGTSDKSLNSNRPYQILSLHRHSLSVTNFV